MLKEKEPTADVGVIIGRFHVHKLHEGHKSLFEYVRKRHNKIIIVLGMAPIQNTKRNPLDYFSREEMIKESYPDVKVIGIKDEPDDVSWSKYLDSQISNILGKETVIIYGSRDSFIPHYHGKFPTVELDNSFNTSGKAIRKLLANQTSVSSDFRHGVIYAAYSQYDKAYMTTDIAVLKNSQGDNPEILLGRKYKDNGLYRLPGGFLEAGMTLEECARKELHEEVGSIEVSMWKYIKSFHVDDWRYKNEKDAITTALFTCEYNFGNIEAGDDLDEAQWFPLTDKLLKIVVDYHKPLLMEILKC